MSKIFGKIKRGKIIIALLFVVMVTSLIIAMAGCSDKEKSTFWDDYGKSKAYNTYGSATLHATSTITYYIDTSVTGNYKTAVTYAIEKANALTDAVTITSSTSSSAANSSFVIKVANLGTNASIAVNSYGYTSSGVIVTSTITLNSYYMKSFSASKKKHVVLHEIGHTYGLTDLDDEAVMPYSVMYYEYSASATYTFTDYQEFDKKNISWYYD